MILAALDVDMLSIADLTVGSSAASSIHLTWTSVSCFPRNGQPLDVNIVVRELPSGVVVGNVTAADSGSYVVTGLLQRTLYSFQISVAHGGMVSQLATSINGTTRDCE